MLKEYDPFDFTGIYHLKWTVDPKAEVFDPWEELAKYGFSKEKPPTVDEFPDLMGHIPEPERPVIELPEKLVVKVVHKRVSLGGRSNSDNGGCIATCILFLGWWLGGFVLQYEGIEAWLITEGLWLLCFTIVYQLIKRHNKNRKLQSR